MVAKVFVYETNKHQIFKEINSEVLLRWILCTGGLLGFAVTCQLKDYQTLHKCLLALSGFHHPFHIPSALPCAEFTSPSSVYTFRISMTQLPFAGLAQAVGPVGPWPYHFLAPNILHEATHVRICRLVPRLYQ